MFGGKTKSSDGNKNVERRKRIGRLEFGDIGLNKRRTSTDDKSLSIEELRKFFLQRRYIMLSRPVEGLWIISIPPNRTHPTNYRSQALVLRASFTHRLKREAGGRDRHDNVQTCAEVDRYRSRRIRISRYCSVVWKMGYRNAMKTHVATRALMIPMIRFRPMEIPFPVPR